MSCAALIAAPPERARAGRRSWSSRSTAPSRRLVEQLSEERCARQGEPVSVVCALAAWCGTEHHRHAVGDRRGARRHRDRLDGRPQRHLRELDSSGRGDHRDEASADLARRSAAIRSARSVRRFRTDGRAAVGAAAQCGSQGRDGDLAGRRRRRRPDLGDCRAERRRRRARSTTPCHSVPLAASARRASRWVRGQLHARERASCVTSARRRRVIRRSARCR